MARDSRMARERETIAAMAEIYCAAQHGTRGALCAECRELLGYAEARLSRCPYQEAKPTCADCPIHCYEPDMRARVRAMMRCRPADAAAAPGAGAPASARRPAQAAGTKHRGGPRLAIKTRCYASDLCHRRRQRDGDRTAGTLPRSSTDRSTACEE